MTDYSKFFDYSHHEFGISDDNWSSFINKGTLVECKKGEKLLNVGDETNEFYAIIDGLLRNYYIDVRGREFTKIFRGRGEIMAPYPEFIEKIPAKYYIESVTNCSALKFKYEDFQKLVRENHSWAMFALKMAETNFLEKEQKEFQFFHLSTPERYEVFQEKFGSFADQIPQYQIASYLGVTPEALNRLLKKQK